MIVMRPVSVVTEKLIFEIWSHHFGRGCPDF